MAPVTVVAAIVVEGETVMAGRATVSSGIGGSKDTRLAMD
jgi:hypothetical protein